MNITITTQSLITAAAVLSAVLALGGAALAIYRWFLRQNKQNDEIQKIKSENTLLCYGIAAATVGQIAKITAVENGVPTAWEPVDLPSGGGGGVIGGD